MAKERMLLHACCGPCSTHVIETLKPNYELTLFFYNPNIYPKDEYLKRLEAVKKVSKEMRVPLIIDEYDQYAWNNAVRGFEGEPEGARRCEFCFRLRLEVTAEYAKKHNYDVYCTTLTISPSKNASLINDIGRELQTEYYIDFLEADFKKDNGYQKSIELSKKLGLYRQTYCGCIYSMNNNRASPKE